MSRNEILRNQRWRLGIIRHAEDVTHNVAKTCRYFGISRSIKDMDVRIMMGN